MSAGERKRGAHKTHKPPLSVRDIRFCQKLVTEGLSQYEAYIAAGFPAKGTRNATDKAASRLVRNRQIREYMRRLQRHAAACAMASAEEVAAEVRNLATADRRKLFDKKGRILPVHLWPDEIAACIDDIETEELFEHVSDGVDENGKKKPKRKELVGYVRKVKTSKHLAAWRQLGEILGVVGPHRKDVADNDAAQPLVIGGEAKLGSL